jgi:hypothetical protein
MTSKTEGRPRLQTKICEGCEGSEGSTEEPYRFEENKGSILRGEIDGNIIDPLTYVRDISSTILLSLSPIYAIVYSTNVLYDTAGNSITLHSCMR